MGQCRPVSDPKYRLKSRMGKFNLLSINQSKYQTLNTNTLSYTIQVHKHKR